MKVYLLVRNYDNNIDSWESVEQIFFSEEIARQKMVEFNNNRFTYAVEYTVEERSVVI